MTNFTLILFLLFASSLQYASYLLRLPPADTVVDFANREFKTLMGEKVPVPVLDERNSTICGVRVDLHNYIYDERAKQEIEEKLGRMKLNVKYEVPMKPEFQKREFI